MIPGLITEGLRRMLGGDPEPSPSPAQTGRKSGGASRRSSVPVGHFSLVGLREVREHLGPRWPQVAERAHAIARAVITKQLLPGDVFEPHDEESYVVLFAQLGPKEAEFKSRAIGREITRRLIGEEFEAASSVRTACAALPVDKAGGLDAEAGLAAVLAAAPAVVSRASDEEPSRQRQPSPSVAKPAPAADAAQETATAVAEQPRSFTAARIGRTEPSWLYTPIWDLKHRVVIQFRLTSASANRQGGSPAPSLEMIFESDIRAVRKAANDLVELASQGKRFSITCPVHAGSVGQPVCRREILKALRGTPSALRRLLTIELVAMATMPSSAQLEHFVGSLKALGVGVSSRMPVKSGSPLLFQPAFSPVVALLGPTDGPEAEQIKLLDNFAALAQTLNLECGAAGLGSTSLILAAAASGFRYLSGRAVQSDVEGISHAVKLDLDRLYSRQTN